VTLHADAVRTLTAWTAPEPDAPGQGAPGQGASGQGALREAFLGFLAARPDAMARSCAPGHLTASTVVLDATLSRVLLTLHPRVGRWLQLGGHCEDDASLAGAALREALEESGIPGIRLDPVPVHLDVHPITCSLGIPTRHFDVRYVAVAPAGAEPVRSSESTDLRWWPTGGLPDGGGDIADVVAAAVARATRADHLAR
jgi:ADP-ribose pyrophosphatase YjhB (NUDIX family)